MGRFLIKKQVVTNFNRHTLNDLLREGKIDHFTDKQTGLRRFYDPSKRYELQIGDRVNDIIME